MVIQERVSSSYVRTSINIKEYEDILQQEYFDYWKKNKK